MLQSLLDDGVSDAVLTNCSPDLCSIDVSGCSIRSVLLMYLSMKERSFHLKRFDLSNNDLTTSVIKSLIKLLCHCIVEELVVVNNNIDICKLNNTIVSYISPQSKILNFNSYVLLMIDPQIKIIVGITFAVQVSI